jgi:hypothetical protein
MTTALPFLLALALFPLSFVLRAHPRQPLSRTVLLLALVVFLAHALRSSEQVYPSLFFAVLAAGLLLRSLTRAEHT